MVWARRAVRTISVGVVAAVLAACGAPVAGTPGRAEPTPAVTEPTQEVTSSDPTPSSSTAPSASLTELGPVDDEYGRTLESRRLAARLPLHTAIDPTLTRFDDPTQILKDDLTPVFAPEQVSFLQQNGGFQLGFVSSRRDPDGTAALLLAVLVFRDQDSASAAAAGLVTVPAGGTAVESTVPGSVAMSRATGEVTDVESVLSSGQLLFYVRSATATAAGTGAELADRALEVLSTALADFTVTPMDQRTSLPVDLDGVGARTVPDDQGRVAVVTVNAMLHLENDLATAQAIFSRAMVDVVAVGRGVVYRTGGGSQAGLVAAHLLTEAVDLAEAVEVEIPGIPEDVDCVRQSGERLHCFGVVGRFAFQLDGEDQDELAAVVVRQIDLLQR